MLPGRTARMQRHQPGQAFELEGPRPAAHKAIVAGQLGANVHAPLTIVCTCTYWRNAWKYQARTYRHFGWDNGTLLANLLAVATALGLPARVVCGFVLHGA